ncbi:DUF6461 domain-containing protein [Micromonospora okii]|uniref:DUF6461 domain-containing protein n=1 Tax=Micromonospora okii TaxID=1182970 RepID=UPI001E3FEE75|nr:DUF6461 domain-containing protein [Micromonospora okii]
MADAVDHYRALLDRRDIPTGGSLCLTAVGLTDVDEALTRYGGFPADRRVSLADVGRWEFPPEMPVVVAARHGEHVLLGEIQGLHGARPEVLRRLSAGTTAASVYWHVNSGGRIVYARDGGTQVDVDAVLGGVPRGDDPGVAALFDGLDFGRGPKAVALAFLERVSGARLTAHWFTAAHPASIVVQPELFDDDRGSLAGLLPGVDDADWRPDVDPAPPEPNLTARRSGEVLRWVVDPTPPKRSLTAQQRSEILRWAADLVVARVLPADIAALPDAAGLGDGERDRLRARLLAAARDSYHAGVQRHWDAVVADLETDEWGPAGGGIEDLIAERAAEEAAERASGEAARRAFAYAAARGRLHADPRQALAAALSHARSADPEGWPALRDDILDLLTSASSR